MEIPHTVNAPTGLMACKGAYCIIRLNPQKMAEDKKHMDFEPQPSEVLLDEMGGGFTIGLLGNNPDNDETRFLLTPEACGMITSSGIRIKMEAGAAVDISFKDEQYAEFGVEIVTREQALKCEIVLSYLPPSVEEIHKMEPGSVLLSMMDNSLFEIGHIQALLDRKITAGCLDNVYSYNDEPVFANIIDEIDGRAAVMYAQDYLSFLGGGKGVLLGSVAGLNPCEVLVIGDGNDVYAACKAAIASGAYVTLMNNDISALQMAKQTCGDALNTIAIHPRVLFNKVKTADVIFIGTTTRSFEFPKKLSVAMKESVYLLDFEESHPSVSVPRTVAMALSNCLVNLFDEMIIKNGFEGMLVSTPGLQAGIVTYNGRLVDKLIGSYLNYPCVDISVMLTAAN